MLEKLNRITELEELRRTGQEVSAELARQEIDGVVKRLFLLIRKVLEPVTL